jgi:hypothetical protein
MKDREWCEKIEAELNNLNNRLKKLEMFTNTPVLEQNSSEKEKIVEIDIIWPEATIHGLHFDSITTHAVFELKEDGNYYSRDILFNSARDLDDGTGTDLLSVYLESEAVKNAFSIALGAVFYPVEKIKVFLPEKNQGTKKYNGVSWWYWLKPYSSGSSAYFVSVSGGGLSDSYYYASSVGGCAPAFCVGDSRHE